jgi:hypothetical protein
MKNIHLLPTDKPNRLVKLKMFGKDKLHLCKVVLPIENEEQYQHIYITSDEAIKEGDWYLIEFNGLKITQCNSVEELISIEGRDDCKKIILTTDPDLIGVQSIDNEFLEWFVKNPSCEFVEVSYGLVKPFKSTEKGYMIHLPDTVALEEPKQESHICKYCDAETTQPDDECYAKPAQYPLEDFIRRESKSGNESVAILKGVIWQSERIPSIIEEYLETAFISKEQGYMNPQKWFEQQKKQII